MSEDGRSGSRRPDGHALGVVCDVDSCEERIAGLDDGWEYSRGIVCRDCIEYHNRHGHWPDEDQDICAECKIDDGAIGHECEEFSGGVILQPGSTCDHCGFEAAVTDGGQPAEDATPRETVEIDRVVSDSGDLARLGTESIGTACVLLVGEPDDAGFLPEKVVVRGELEVVPYEEVVHDE